MGNTSKLKKAVSFKNAGDTLVREGKKREGIHLYWIAIRDLIFLELQKEHISFQSTSEALAKYVSLQNEKHSAEILSIYCFGIQAGWEEYFEKNFTSKEIDKIINTQLCLYEKLSNDITEKYLNLWKLNGLLYKHARKAYITSRNHKWVLLGVSVFIIILLPAFHLFNVNNYTNTIVIISWLLFSLVAFLTVNNFLQIQKSKALYRQAERLRNFLFFKGIYPSSFSGNIEASILGDIDAKYQNEAKEKVPIGENPDNYLEDEDDTSTKLAFRFYENSFFTYMIYERFSKVIKKDIFIGSAIFAMLLVFLFIFLSLFKLENDGYYLLLPRVLAIIISFLFGIDYLSYYSSFKEKGQIIKVIDAKLEKMITNPNEKQILLLYDYYNSILWDCPPIQTNFFLNQKDNLNELVTRRMTKIELNTKINQHGKN